MYLKLNLKLLVVFLCITSFSNAQQTDFFFHSIPKELKENANAVVRNDQTIIDVESAGEMSIKVNRIVTVLNKLGNRKVGAVVGYDNNSRIAKLSAKIYNAFGKEIKKVSKKKFVDVSAVDGGTLYSDSRVKYLDYTPVSYPYTVHVQYEVRSSSTGFLPNWKPLEGYLVSTQKSSYAVNIPEGGKVRVKEFNLEGYKVGRNVSSTKVNYSINNVLAVKNEALSPSLESFRPKVLLALNNFKTDGVRGYYTNWSEFGKWMNDKLLVGRGVVDGATKLMIESLVANVDDDVEKAKLVYDFMQKKTRYISVQVGIGGIQPIPASEVDNVGYGDCKGLTNYMKALLDIAGVTSYYTHIEANSSEQVSFEKDFASLEQGNHVILNLPNNGNDIWLECTSQTAPFGFLGDFTDDRDALVITPEGGIIKHTTSYKNEHNLQEIESEIQLDSLGAISAITKIESYGTQYDDSYGIEALSLKDLKKYYKSSVWNYNNNLTVDKVELNNDKDKVLFVQEVALRITDFAEINNGKLLFRVNVFNRNSYIPKRYRKRKLPLQIRRGYKDVDVFKIKIPAAYKVDGFLFEKKSIETKFGNYSISVSQIDKATIVYKRTLFIKEGTHPKEDYKSYRSFRKNIAKYDNLRIALTKK